LKPLTHTTPRNIEEIISKYIVGQKNGIRTISTALSAHISRIIYNKLHCDRIRKDLLLVCGNSGTGKTESLTVALNALDMPIPFAIVGANTLSAVGYKGRSVDSILVDLISSAKNIISQDVFRFVDPLEFSDESKRGRAVNKAIIDLCETGIIYIDEFDKLAPRNQASTDPGYAKNMINSLLKIVEGGKGFGEDELSQQIDTTDILFIFSGAFADMLKPERIVYDIGFNCKANIQTEVDVPTTKDLINYGFSLELCGRITQRCRFYDLTEDDLYKILKESRISPIYDYQRLLDAASCHLTVEDAACSEIAKKAMEIGTGARGLKTVLGGSIMDILYDVDGKYKNVDVVITPDVIKNNAKPLIREYNNKEPPTFYKKRTT